MRREKYISVSDILQVFPVRRLILFQHAIVFTLYEYHICLRHIYIKSQPVRSAAEYFVISCFNDQEQASSFTCSVCIVCSNEDFNYI